jgi:hypothetical protein
MRICGHSPEPWVVDGDGDLPAIKDADGSPVVYSEGVMTRRDARRIVACVNALAGIPDDVVCSPKLNAFLSRMPAMHHRAMMEWNPHSEAGL